MLFETIIGYINIDDNTNDDSYLQSLKQRYKHHVSQAEKLYKKIEEHKYRKQSYQYTNKSQNRQKLHNVNKINTFVLKGYWSSFLTDIISESLYDSETIVIVGEILKNLDNLHSSFVVTGFDKDKHLDNLRKLRNKYNLGIKIPTDSHNLEISNNEIDFNEESISNKYKYDFKTNEINYLKDILSNSV